MKGRRELLVASLAVLAPITSYAQSVGLVRRIGVLGNVAPPANAGSPIQVFIATLRDLGWIEAKTVAFDYRWAQQRYEPKTGSQPVGWSAGVGETALIDGAMRWQM
ncbi:MAG: hypothetical protein EOP82_07990 [Variovorax sp.]|nr:MAG: hypothetical protein EOP82_07990 [Variovorax sp.]